MCSSGGVIYDIILVSESSKVSLESHTTDLPEPSF